MSNRLLAQETLEMFQGEARTFRIAVVDAAGVAVDVSSYTLKFVVYDASNPPIAKFKEVSPQVVKVGGGTGGLVDVTVQAANSATANNDWHWALWSTSDLELAYGAFKIRPAAKDYP